MIKFVSRTNAFAPSVFAMNMFCACAQKCFCHVVLPSQKLIHTARITHTFFSCYASLSKDLCYVQNLIMRSIQIRWEYYTWIVWSINILFNSHSFTLSELIYRNGNDYMLCHVGAGSFQVVFFFFFANLHFNQTLYYTTHGTLLNDERANFQTKMKFT